MLFKQKFANIVLGSLFVFALQGLPFLIANSATAQDLVKRGEYLVEITGCHAYHTPVVAGPSLWV